MLACMPQIGPGNALHFHLQLQRWDPPVPKLPSQAEIAEQRRLRAQKEAEMAKKEPTIGA